MYCALLLLCLTVKQPIAVYRSLTSSSFIEIHWTPNDVCVWWSWVSLYYCVYHWLYMLFTSYVVCTALYYLSTSVPPISLCVDPSVPPACTTIVPVFITSCVHHYNTCLYHLCEPVCGVCRRLSTWRWRDWRPLSPLCTPMPRRQSAG